MDQKRFNERVVMSLLRQCAWMWEHCMKNHNDGEFSFAEVWKGMSGSTRNRMDSRTGMVFTETMLCQYWDVFNRNDRIDGLEFDRETMMSRMTFRKDDGYDFMFSFPIDAVFCVTRDFCMGNGCQSLMNRTRFCARGGERWAMLPEAQQPKSKARAKVTRMAQTSQKETTTLDLAERLRQALLKRLAA